MPTVKITVDDQELECDASLNLIQAVALLGIEIPHYCWHPDLQVSGNCRMCLVDVDAGRGPMPTIACNEQVTEGMTVSTKNDNVLKMREEVLEFLFLNHPLDCPICDKAGECLLQDYYQDHGLYESRLTDDVGKLGKGVKATNLSDLIVFDNERCILCDRCVRFCREVEGKEELYIGGRGSPSKVIMFPGQELTGEYQLCLTDICPVGALTSSEFRFRKRVWFLEKTKSVCGLRDTGDNILIEHRDGKIYRIMPRRHNGINGVWVKDVSRLACKDWQADRFMSAIQGDIVMENDEAVSVLADAVRNAAAERLLLVVDNRVTLEEAYALKTVFESAGGRRFAQSESRFAIERGPNGHGLDQFGFDPLTDDMLDAAGLVLAVGDFKEEQIKTFAGVDNLYLATAHNSLMPSDCKLVLPLNEHMERSGSFVNRQMRVQRAHKAFDAPLENLSGVEIAVGIAEALETTLGFTTQKEAFTALAGAHLDRPGMRWKELGNLGLLLNGEPTEAELSSIGGHARLTWSG